MDLKRIQSINLAQILEAPGTKEASGVIEDAIGLEKEQIALAEEARWSVTVTNVGEEFWLAGEIHGTAMMECRRCLAPTPVPVHAYFQHLLRYQPGTEGVQLVEEPEEDVYFFGAPDLDLSGFLAEAFVVELPLAPLCKEDCAGLCPVCGANRNEVDCGHDQDAEPPHPLSDLGALLGKLD